MKLAIVGSRGIKHADIWDGKSKGTTHIMNYTRKLGKPVFVFCPNS